MERKLNDSRGHSFKSCTFCLFFQRKRALFSFITHNDRQFKLQYILNCVCQRIVHFQLSNGRVCRQGVFTRPGKAPASKSTSRPLYWERREMAPPTARLLSHHSLVTYALPDLGLRY